VVACGDGRDLAIGDAPEETVDGDTVATKTLVIVNDSPYGSERPYNALRLANALAKRDRQQVKLFLMGDAASCAGAGQKVPDGYYNLERMLKSLRLKGGEIGVCGSCMDARGVTDERLVEGAARSTLEALADWTVWADRVLVF
jgi:uncharacterized protein involved in oxidation of intracellular sulfur